MKVIAANGSISNNGGRILNTAGNTFTFVNAGKNITNTNGVIASEGTVMLRGNNVDNRGEIVSKGAASIFAMNSLNNSGLINSGSSLIVYGPSSVVNSGKMISVDWLQISGNGKIDNNNGQIVSAKEISLWDPTLNSTKGLGAPRRLINGYDQIYNFSIPVIDYWSGYYYDYHLYLDALSVAPAGFASGLASAVNGLLYAYEGDKKAAFIEFASIPLAVADLKGIGKLAAGATVEQAAVKEAEKVGTKLTEFDLQLLAKGPDIPNSFNMVKDSYLKKIGFDAHAIKAEALGTKKDLDKFDIFVDKNTGELWVFRKGGTGEGIPNGEYIK